jgi:hypothetical protein
MLGSTLAAITSPHEINDAPGLHVRDQPLVPIPDFPV